MATKYWVLNGNTLGFELEAQPGWFSPLGRNVDGLAWQDGPVPIKPTDKLKKAGLAEFAKFRVRPEGHLQPTRAEALAQVWRNTHKDFKGVYNGVKTVMIFRNGSTLVPLDQLTDAELEAACVGFKA